MENLLVYENEPKFFKQDPKSSESKGKTNQMGLRNFYKAKKNLSQMKTKPIAWDKMFTKSTSDMSLIFSMHKEPKALCS